MYNGNPFIGWFESYLPTAGVPVDPILLEQNFFNVIPKLLQYVFSYELELFLHVFSL